MPPELKSKARSSPAADAAALLCAAGLVALALIFRRDESRLYPILAMTLAFALLARVARGVSTSGALAGAVIAFILAKRDLRLFFVLLVLFCVTLLATRIGRSRKQKLELAESETGRSASQVMANLGVAGLVLALPSVSSAFLLALAALAEVAADTTSSEIGAALPTKTMLITTLKPVPPGTDGGISLTGTAAGVFAAVILAVCARAVGLVQWPWALAIACVGTAGMLVDSILGATVERKGYLNNDLVNLLSTASAALLMWLLTHLRGVPMTR